ESRVPPAFRLRRTRPSNGALPRALRTSPCVRGCVRRLSHFAIVQRAGLEPKTDPSSVVSSGPRDGGACADDGAVASTSAQHPFRARRQCSSLSGIARRARTAAWVYA
ncbi:uncharacterized protein TRAVEDRAFT_32574, partial [Trametes versicolor FP-101664 SS1]